MRKTHMESMVGKQHFTKIELRNALAKIRAMAVEEIKKWKLKGWERNQNVIWVKDELGKYFNGSLSHDFFNYVNIRKTLEDQKLFPRPIEFMKVHLESGWSHATSDIDHGFIIKNGYISTF